MKNLMIGLVIAAVAGAILLPSGGASARDRSRDRAWQHHHHHHHHHWDDRHKNRRDARRAGVVAGVMVNGVANAAGRAEVNRRYEDCLMATGYDYECERRRYYDEQQSRRGARRAGVAAGVVTHSIVRY